MIKTVNLRVPALRIGVVADQLTGVPTGGSRGIQLLMNIGKEQQLVGGDTDFIGNIAVRGGFTLGPDVGIEIPAEQWLQIAGITVTEQQFLRFHRAGRVNV